MDAIWNALGLDPTQDISSIRRAYAERARTCHPEEDPEGFMKLRQAYQAALAWAEKGEEPPAAGPEEDGPERSAPEDEGWSLNEGPALWDEGPNPFAEHPAAVVFRALYTGKRRKDAKAWMDYFTSDDFLDAAWARRFTGLLLEEVTRLEKEYPIPREFLTWLCAAYRFAVDRSVYREGEQGKERIEFSFRIDQDAQFEGQEFLFQLAARGPGVKPLKGAEQAVSRSFADYRALVHLAQEGGWTEEKLKKAGKILDFYMIGNLQDRNPAPSERHPAGLRLINHFFQREKLPKVLYQMAWQKLELKTALMGRAKLFYGVLRERVLEQAPDVAADELDIWQLNKEVEAFRQKVRALEETGKPEDWEKAGEETKAFVGRPVFQKALRNRKFAQEHMKYHVQWCGEHFAQEVLDFYRQEPDAPCAAQLTQLIRESRRRREIDLRNGQDNEAEIPEKLTLACRPLFRHWLNTGFYHAMDRETKQPLLGYLNQELPYLPEWSRKFLGVEGEETPEPVSLTLHFGEDKIEVRFHLRYISFRRNGEPVYRPCLPWERVSALRDTDAFFFLLPVTANTYDQYGPVKAEVLRRLTDTAAPEDGRDFIAACLADQICGLPVPDAVGLEEGKEPEWARSLPPESVLPFQIFAENTQLLYVCIWFQRDQILALFQQTAYGQQLVEGGEFEDIEDAQTAIALAGQLLAGQLHPKGFPMEALKVLPEAVYVQWDHRVVCHDEDPRPLWNIPRQLHGEEVQADRLEEYLAFFDAGRVERMEWSWKCAFPADEAPMDHEPRRSLVLMKSGGWYVCLYFDDFCAESYALLEKPELYGKNKADPKQLPFRQGRLFRDVLHRSFFTIRRHLDKIFAQVSWPNNVKFMAGRIWSYAVNVDHGRVKYNLDKQLVGGFPVERARNRSDAPFYFYDYPNSVVRLDAAGDAAALEVTEGNRPRMQQLLADFLAGEGQRFRLTWGKKMGQRRHIVLTRDGGRFLMAWVREDKRTAEFHAADKWTYMDVEGKKYPKDTFLGKVTPAYLIHDLPTLRNALDLLLANLDHPERVTDPIGEYAWEKPGKPRPYEVLWAELVGDEQAQAVSPT